MQGKEQQKKVVLLSNLFNNKLDDFINNFDKKHIIYCH